MLKPKNTFRFLGGSLHFGHLRRLGFGGGLFTATSRLVPDCYIKVLSWSCTATAGIARRWVDCSWVGPGLVISLYKVCIQSFFKNDCNINWGPYIKSRASLPESSPSLVMFTDREVSFLLIVALESQHLYSFIVGTSGLYCQSPTSSCTTSQ